MTSNKLYYDRLHSTTKRNLLEIRTLEKRSNSKCCFLQNRFELFSLFSNKHFSENSECCERPLQGRFAEILEASLWSLTLLACWSEIEKQTSQTCLALLTCWSDFEFDFERLRRLRGGGGVESPHGSRRRPKINL